MLPFRLVLDEINIYLLAVRLYHVKYFVAGIFDRAVGKYIINMLAIPAQLHFISSELTGIPALGGNHLAAEILEKLLA